MLLNNTVSACVGLIPVGGDIVLAVFKANSRNAALLEEFLRIRGEEFLKLQTKEAGGPLSTTNEPPKKDIDQVNPGHGMSGEVATGSGADTTKGASRNLSFSSWRNSFKDKKKGIYHIAPHRQNIRRVEIPYSFASLLFATAHCLPRVTDELGVRSDDPYRENLYRVPLHPLFSTRYDSHIFLHPVWKHKRLSGNAAQLLGTQESAKISCEARTAR